MKKRLIIQMDKKDACLIYNNYTSGFLMSQLHFKFKNRERERDLSRELITNNFKN